MGRVKEPACSPFPSLTVSLCRPLWAGTSMQPNGGAEILSPAAPNSIGVLGARDTRSGHSPVFWGCSCHAHSGPEVLLEAPVPHPCPKLLSCRTDSIGPLEEPSSHPVFHPGLVHWVFPWEDMKQHPSSTCG